MLIISLVVALVLVGADQLIKYLIVQNYEVCTGYIKSYYTFSIGDFDVFSLTHIRNSGAGWSILEGKTVFLIAFTSLIMLVILFYMIIQRKTMNKFEMLSLALILAGGVGNLIDRARMIIDPEFTGVIDYIKLDFINFPIFNFADICVVVGGISLIVVFAVLEAKAAKKNKLENAAKSAAMQTDAQNQDNVNADGGDNNA
ncbi:MAG TPA: signal peptidase II [Candidatus Faeciplasma gallinarum]|uniref:Lipoprotein signal peptidase n=1 Tax=Candidatus Faeciplasma gallinarum TaxID=2840799 RepID=A0A9D1EQ13_9FIRM|nr:signal peptidase II [Candidatus Faeciplasma gallinarum]